MTGNGPVQAPSKAIILRAARANRRARERARAERPGRAAATTLIGLCNCLAEHCGKGPVYRCLKLLYKHGPRRCPGNSPNMSAGRWCAWVRAYCVSMAPLREVSAAASRSTACRLWWSCGPPPGPAFGTRRKKKKKKKIHPAVLAPTVSGPVSHRSPRSSVYFGRTFAWARNCECARV